MLTTTLATPDSNPLAGPRALTLVLAASLVWWGTVAAVVLTRRHQPT